MPICSSKSGHSIAYPSPNNCQFCRSTGEAFSKRGYQAKGTRIRRPSERLTVRSSSVTLTFTAIGSISSTKVLMPCLQKSRLMLCSKTSNVVQFMPWKAPIFCHCNRVKPKLGDSTFSFHVNVRRLAFIRTKKDEAIRAIFKHSRHSWLSVSSLYIKSD